MRKQVLILFFLIPSVFIQASVPGGKGNQASERALFRQAERYFVKKDFERATPLYEQLVSKYADNYKLNYCYGICLLITSKDKSLAVKHLEEASKSILVWDDVWYYLGRAYQLSGDYTKSIGSYDQFVKMVSPKQVLRWEAIHQMEMCNSALILSKIPDSLAITDVKITGRDQVISTYDFKHDTRKQTELPEAFAGSRDKPGFCCSKAFLSSDGNKMVFAAYGKDKETGTDIYWSEMTAKGRWTKPEKLNGIVNTKYDECFPSFSEDGQTLYFSSRGHNSMGGLDIFRTVYYPQTRSWSKPENMGVPVNSADDDFYYIASESEGIAYYSSFRDCGQGDARVYRIRLNDNPEALIVINGEVLNEYAPPVRLAKIRIVRMDNDSMIAEFTSDPVNGKYRYFLPATGSYRVSVRVEGFGPMAQTLYFSSEAKGLIRQTIRVSKDSMDYDKLRIINDFESPAPVSVAGVDSSVAETTAEYAANTSVSNKTVSTGSEPITMYSVSGLPPVSEAAKEKLRNYFYDLHKTFPSEEKNMPVNLADVNSGGTTYRVQIGTFMHQTVDQVYAKLTAMGFEDISYYTNKKGWNIFYTGHAGEIAPTLKLKALVISYGFEDAFIKVFENGKFSRSPKK